MNNEQDIIQEIKKCSEDIFYFISKYVYILSPRKGKIKLEIFDYQRRYIETIINNKYVIVNKPRQCGISTITGIFCLWYACFHPNKEIVIVSINDREAMYFLDMRIKFLYDNCPQWLVGNLKKETEHLIEFDNGSFIEALPTTKRALRGRTPAVSIVDEIAFNQFASIMMTSALPSLIHGEHIILISTPNGVEGIGKYFYQTWTKAVNKENEFVPFEINWWEVPLYNPKAPQYVDWKENEWALQQYKNAESEAAFRQEILKEWISTEEKIIPHNYLSSLIPIPPIRTDFLKEIDITPEDVYNLPDIGYENKFSYIKGLWIWKNPIPNHYYTLGVDVSSGRGNDFSAIEVIDIVNLEQVCEYKFKIPQNYLAEIVYEIATYYNNAFVGVEINYGEEVLNRLLEKDYNNIYYREKRKELLPGFETNLKTRPMLITLLQEAIMSNNIKIYSSRLISELHTFIYSNGKPQAQKGFTDDLIFAFMISLYIIENYIITKNLSTEIQRLSQNNYFNKKINKNENIQNFNILIDSVDLNYNIDEEENEPEPFNENEENSFEKETDSFIVDLKFKDFIS